MMLRNLACAVFVAATVMPAQTLIPAGTSLHTYANSFTRGLAGMGAGELVQRFDADMIRGFGVEAAYPGQQVVRGVSIHGRDFGGSVPNGLVDVTLYTEDPANPDYPLLTQPLGSVTGVALQSFPFALTYVYFTPPVLAPVGGDLFVGVKVNATTSQIGGARLNLLPGIVSSSLPYDLAGAGMPTSPPSANSSRLFRDLTTNAMTYQSRGQYMIELLTTAPGGFPATLSNQTSISNPPPGATTMMSGLYPDAASPPLNANRVDDVGFVYVDPVLAIGSPVAFIASFADFGPVVALDTLVPGSVGGLCLEPSALFPLAVATLSTGHDAWVQTTIAPAVRPALHGQFWTQQAIGFDLTTGVLRGTLCGKQKF